MSVDKNGLVNPKQKTFVSDGNIINTNLSNSSALSRNTKRGGNYNPSISIEISSLLAWFGLIAFFLASLNLSTNPIDMFFGDGEGNGGILNIFADFGDSTISFMNSQINTFKSWGIVDSGNSIIDLLGNILTIITFLVNLVVQFLVFILRLIMFIITGGAVEL